MCEVTRLDQPLDTAGTVLPSALGNMHDPIAFSSQFPAGQRRGRSEYLWEAHKATIKTLYIDEGRSLKDVRETMKSKYGFEGS